MGGEGSDQGEWRGGDPALQPLDPLFKARARFTDAATVRGDTASANIAKPLATTALRFASTFESRLAVVARAASVALSGR